MAAKKKAHNSTGRMQHHPVREITVERALVENLVALQRIMVTLSARFESLSNNIVKLLELFETSAKSLAKKDFEDKGSTAELKKIMEKLDSLVQQSGLIGRGLALMHESNSERQVAPMPPVRPIEQPRPSTTETSTTTSLEGYQKSILRSETE